MRALIHVTDVAIFATWFLSLAYVVLYAVTAPFYRSWIGWHMFGMGCIIFAVSSLAVAGLLFGQDYGAKPFVRGVFWIATSIVVSGKLVTLYHAQVRKKK